MAFVQPLAYLRTEHVLVMHAGTTKKKMKEKKKKEEERERELFYLTTHSTHFIYGYMASDIW